MRCQWFLFNIALLSTEFCDGYKLERTFLDNYTPLLRVIKGIANRELEVLSSSRQSRILRMKLKKFQMNPFKAFPCNLNITLRSPQKPSSVHQVRPGDIDVVGALGDSLTAGYGIEAAGLIDILHESRGSTFSIGGYGTWKTQLTLPNILKNFNPNIYGYSLNSITTDRNSKFNVAEGGAISQNMPYMTRVLLKRMMNDKRVNLKEDWKMITVLIGHNDFCSEACYRGNFAQMLKEHEDDMLDMLRTIRDNLPRTMVNLIPPIHLRQLLEMKDKPQRCFLTHSSLCPCLFGLATKTFHLKILDLMTKWQLLDQQIAGYKEFDRDDFTVITHNFTRNYVMPKTPNGENDYGYLAPDCFHASQRGHAQFSNVFWNSLLQPYGRKDTNSSYHEFEKFLCPTEQHPFIYTRRNS